MGETSLHIGKRGCLMVYNGKSEDYCQLCNKTTQLCQTFALDNSKCFIHFYII